MNKTDQESVDSKLFNRLRSSYLLALSLIALALLGEHLLVESFLTEQAKDANIINVAGRQRMLSQRIAKLSFLENDPANRSLMAAELAEWTSRHEWLKDQLATDQVLPQLLALDTLMAQMSEQVQSAKAGMPEEGAGPQDAMELVKQGMADSGLNARSETYLSRMDVIVGEISEAATNRVNRLRSTKKWITLAVGIVLLLELLFIFQPISRFVRRQFLVLEQEKVAQAEARQLAERAVREKAASLGKLSALNQAIDRAALFATLRADGSILHLSRKFAELLARPGSGPGRESLSQLLHQEEGRQAFFSELITAARIGDWQGEWRIQNQRGEEYWLEVALLPARQEGEAEVFLLASDITARKEAQHSLDVLNEEKMSEEIERGKQRSRQIVETQEKERLRVARDLHDGIGQKLTALKFSLESLRPDKPQQIKDRIEQLRALSKEIILGVRLATFNLTPPELMDYGLVPALEKMARELSRLTGERIVFHNEDVDFRLEATAEINLYRTVQEAVNNAVKYAKANYILISLSAGPQLLSVTIDDDGEGFEREDLTEKTDGSGMGLSFMEERVRNLNGRIFLRSNPEGGTRISINLPLPEILAESGEDN